MLCCGLQTRRSTSVALVSSLLPFPSSHLLVHSPLIPSHTSSPQSSFHVLPSCLSLAHHLSFLLCSPHPLSFHPLLSSSLTFTPSVSLPCSQVLSCTQTQMRTGSLLCLQHPARRRARTEVSLCARTHTHTHNLISSGHYSHNQGFGIPKHSEKRGHAFISSRVDYCNGLLRALLKKTIKQL